MPVDSPPTTSSLTRPQSVAAGCCLALAGCTIAGWLPFGSLRLFILECWPALLIVLAGVGLGGATLLCLGLGRAPPRWQIVLGGGMGMGLLALLVLGLGCAGYLSRNFWFAIVAALAVIGAAVIIRAVLIVQQSSDTLPIQQRLIRWLWILAMPALALGIFAASFPPGILWSSEGNGYDVLEYHFGAPREYFDAGRITFLPHNIYGNFPFNVEMLYLLTFVLRGGPHEAAVAAQFLNVLLGCWAVAAAWLAGRTINPTAGHVAGVLTASCPWLAWLCGIAYVENGMMMFIGVAIAALIEGTRIDAAPLRPFRWMAASGLATGLACGCKYTAIPMAAAPLLIATIIIGMKRRSWMMPVAFFIGTALAFAPWMIKNAVFTGNPIFPLARAIFPERSDVWSEDGAARWHEGHLPVPDQRSLTGRLSAVRGEIIDKGRFGWLLYAGVVGAMVWPIRRAIVRLRKGGESGVLTAYLTCAGLCATGLGVWLAATHLQDRFLVPIIIPAAILVALALSSLSAVAERVTTLLIVMGVAGFGLYQTHRLFDEGFAFQYAKHAVGDSGSFDPDLLAEAMRSGEVFGAEHLRHVIDVTERGGKVLMVGDARAFYLNASVDYCVVFNRNPLDSAARRFRRVRLLEWLRNRGYTHVYVDWSEMNRLRRSRYGFWDSIDEDLFDELVRFGLRRIVDIPGIKPNGPPRATLFQVPK